MNHVMKGLGGNDEFGHIFAFFDIDVQGGF